MNTGFVERHTNPQLDEQSDTSLSSFNGYLHKVRATLRDLVSGRIRAVIEGAKLPKERFQFGPLRIAKWHRRGVDRVGQRAIALGPVGHRRVQQVENERGSVRQVGAIAGQTPPA
jgi:hypothetical protein